ncbi:MAG: ATP-binding cassette domain-containing protein [Chitinophagales bacterium]|nr:ATP-binding cassette domain-containing protein [Chitinophagales bacterium]
MIKCDIHKNLHGAVDKMKLDIDLTIDRRSFLAIYGASGAGKTSLLKILSGLMKADSGVISFDDTLWFDNEMKIDLPPQKRSVGFVFQEYSLFPNMTIKGNLEYALRKGDSKKTIDELLDIMQIKNLAESYPKNLSGGQQQRVALARAVVQKPKLLLLDEPFSALDDALRSQMQEYILKIHNRYALTTIMVSHNKSEIIRMADRVIELENGKISEDEEPSHLFQIKKLKVNALVLNIDRDQLKIEVDLTGISNFVKVGLDQIEQIQVGDTVTLEIEYSGGKVTVEGAVLVL